MRLGFVEALLNNQARLNLNEGDVLVILQIAKRQWPATAKRPECLPFPSVMTLAKECGRTDRWVRGILAKLEKKELLHRIERPGMSSEYNLNGLCHRLDVKVNEKVGPRNKRSAPTDSYPGTYVPPSDSTNPGTDIPPTPEKSGIGPRNKRSAESHVVESLSRTSRNKASTTDVRCRATGVPPNGFSRTAVVLVARLRESPFEIPEEVGRELVLEHGEKKVEQYAEEAENREGIFNVGGWLRDALARGYRWEGMIDEE